MGCFLRLISQNIYRFVLPSPASQGAEGLALYPQHMAGTVMHHYIISVDSDDFRPDLISSMILHAGTSRKNYASLVANALRFWKLYIAPREEAACMYFASAKQDREHGSKNRACISCRYFLFDCFGVYEPPQENNRKLASDDWWTRYALSSELSVLSLNSPIERAEQVSTMFFGIGRCTLA